MSDVLLLYLFTRVDVLLAVCAFVVLIAVFGIAVACIFRFDSWGDEGWPVFFRPAVIALCVAGAVLLVVPDQKSLAIMIGGKVAIDAARSPDAQEIGDLLVDRIKDVLREKE